MSQKVSRKTAVNEEKEKRQTDSPVKDMKKKVAANAEKEKQAAEKSSDKPADKKVEKPSDKKAEKATEKKADKPTEKATEKTDKSAEKVEKPVDKAEKSDKQEKPDKSGDKKNEKQTKEDSKKSEPQAEKSKADSSKEEKSEKPDKSDAKKPDNPKQKQNGRDRVHNGVSDVTLGTNGTDDVLNGTVSADSEDDDVMLVIDDNDDNDHDELFPELTYEDNSDVECFEVPTPENGPSRSLTRRSQVKATRTPETPRPASGKPTDKDADDPKDKVLKLKEDAHTTTTDRRLRSSNSPKPQEGKKSETKKDSPKKGQEGLEKVEEEEAAKSDEKGQESKEVTIEVTVDVPGNEGEELRKTDTNYSKSRVKVSPYRRSMRIADQTNTSLQANYTGNNTTMEMDITESSLAEEAPLGDSAYLRGLRSIRARCSYKPLNDITLRHATANRSLRSNASTSVTSPISDSHNRPTGTVVGRKRKPDNDDIEIGVEVTEPCHIASKRMRVLDRLTEPFRRVAAAAAMPSVARRNAEIVGINTDLPLSAPVSSTETFDPESLKQVAPAPLPPLSTDPVAVPLPPRDDRDNKRCSIM